jgi:hypothetical protein
MPRVAKQRTAKRRGSCALVRRYIPSKVELFDRLGRGRVEGSSGSRGSKIRRQDLTRGGDGFSSHDPFAGKVPNVSRRQVVVLHWNQKTLFPSSRE